MSHPVKKAQKPSPAVVKNAPDVENPELRSKSLIDILSGLLYYKQNPQTPETRVKFESLTSSQQGPYYQTVNFVLEAIDNMDKVLVPKEYSQKRTLNDEDRKEKMTQAIKTFVKGLNTTKPDLFPCEELAYKIIALRLHE